MEMKPIGVHSDMTFDQPRRKINIVLLVSLICAVGAVALLSVSLATPKWIDTPFKNMGLWKQCAKSQGTSAHCVAYTDPDGSMLMMICRILLFIAIGLCTLSLLLLTLGLCHKSPRCTAITSGILLIFSTLISSAIIGLFTVAFVLAGASVSYQQSSAVLNAIGYSFIVCCVADGFSFLGAILAFVGSCLQRSGRFSGSVVAQ